MLGEGKEWFSLDFKGLKVDFYKQLHICKSILLTLRSPHKSKLVRWLKQEAQLFVGLYLTLIHIDPHFICVPF